MRSCGATTVTGRMRSDVNAIDVCRGVEDEAEEDDEEEEDEDKDEEDPVVAAVLVTCTMIALPPLSLLFTLCTIPRVHCLSTSTST